MHCDTSSGITGFEASNADRPLRQSRYGNVDFAYFLRNQPRYKSASWEKGGGGETGHPSSESIRDWLPRQTEEELRAQD